MEKFWKNNNDGSYTFLANGKNYGTLEKLTTNKSCVSNITIENSKFKILRKGFWKSNIVILDDNGVEVLSVKPLKWYGKTYSINYINKKYTLYTLKIDNNPLAEWSIYQDSTLQLAYALSTSNGKPGLKISDLSDAPILFHFLLWYLIKPVIIENIGQDSDIMLLTVTSAS